MKGIIIKMLTRLSRITTHITHITAPVFLPTTPATFSVLSSSPHSFRYLNGAMSPACSPKLPPKGRLYQSAACLIIGDEVLNGKVIDTNSHFLAKHLFNLGIPLNRIETIPDSSPDIISSVRRLSSNYDFVVTSGGIGPTHDDITYPAIAQAYNLPLQLHTPTVEHMKRLEPTRVLKAGESVQDWDTPTPQLEARLRMAMLPVGEGVEYIFPNENFWVPIVIVNHNIHILPGVPMLFQSLLQSFTPYLLAKGHASPVTQQIHRVLVSTPLSESEVAEYLANLQSRVDSKGVKVGSYPRWEKKRNTVTLVGRDLVYLESLVQELEEAIQGTRVHVEGEDDSDTEGETGKEEGLSRNVEETGKKLERLEIQQDKKNTKATQTMDVM